MKPRSIFKSSNTKPIGKGTRNVCFNVPDAVADEFERLAKSEPSKTSFFLKAIQLGVRQMNVEAAVRMETFLRQHREATVRAIYSIGAAVILATQFLGAVDSRIRVGRRALCTTIRHARRNEITA